MKRPLPVADADSEMYWQKARERELWIQRCPECGQHIFFPRHLCPVCHSGEPTWVRAIGRGRVYSYTVLHKPLIPALQDRVPYIVAIVELEEGCRMVANVLDCPLEEITVGLPVEVTYEDVGDGVTLPQFRPAQQEDRS